MDTPGVNLIPVFEEINKTIEDHISRDEKVFIHCMRGCSRSAAVAIAYLMKSQSLRYQDAFNKIKILNPSANPNEGFCDQLKSYDKIIP